MFVLFEYVIWEKRVMQWLSCMIRLIARRSECQWKARTREHVLQARAVQPDEGTEGKNLKDGRKPE